MSDVELDKCYLCDKIFQDLEEHFYDKHTSWKIYTCGICKQKYNYHEEHFCKQKLEQFPLEAHKKVSNEKINRSEKKFYQHLQTVDPLKSHIT